MSLLDRPDAVRAIVQAVRTGEMDAADAAGEALARLLARHLGTTVRNRRFDLP